MQGQAYQLHILWELVEGNRDGGGWRERQASVWTRWIEENCAALTLCDCGGPQWHQGRLISFRPRPASAGRVWDDSKEMHRLFALLQDRPGNAASVAVSISSKIYSKCSHLMALSHFNSLFVLGESHCWQWKGIRERRRVWWAPPNPTVEAS